MEQDKEERVSFRIAGKADEVAFDLESFDVPPQLGFLRGRPPPVNMLTSREMDSLTAVCDTLLPSMDVPADRNDPSVATFYRTSASMLKTPQRVGGYMSGRLQHVMLGTLRLTLWFLSTWYGTFVICGWRSLSSEFPYFQRLSQIVPDKREQILLSWSSSPFGLFRMLFNGLKFLVVLFYFTQVNDENDNPVWKAIGYCGPDPEFVDRTKVAADDKEDLLNEEAQFGPLHRALVHIDGPMHDISTALSRAGISICSRSRSGTESPTKSPLLTIECDAVVVGSGSGGGVVGGVLAKAGYKVVVLEKGSYYARNNLSLLEGHTMDNMYEGGGLLATDDLGVIVLAGSTVGGGSAVNWSASIKTPEHVMEEWCNEYGLELFGSDAYRHAMDAVCDRMGVQHEVCHEGFNNAVLRLGCAELGYPVNNIPRNSPSDHYCGWCCFGCRDGRKKGTTETWLVDVVDSGNGVVLPRCEAVEVVREKKGWRSGGVARGVVFEIENKWSGKKERYAVDSKVTIVACGALGTPSLLSRSGLRNRNIGKHLHLHPVVMVWGHFPETGSRWPENEKKSYEGGIMTAMSTVVYNSTTTGYGAVIQTPALHPGMFSVLAPWLSGADFRDRMTRFSRTAHVFALARDKGSGTVDLPRSLTYRLDRDDEKSLMEGVEKMLRIMAAAGAEEIGTQHKDGASLNVKRASSHEFERFLKEEARKGLRNLATPICSAHQMGSCRMGVDPARSAVDSRGETWEVEGLFVADASVFPTALGVNPMVTVQAIAYCTAQSVLEVLRRSKPRIRNSNKFDNIMKQNKKNTRAAGP